MTHPRQYGPRCTLTTKFTIATFIGDEKMFREAVEAYRKWRSK
ncbi:host cell division inhibitory peptide Kil [Escherichia coli]|nr:host cell division inhibitory peptide Kil [Escherichia coli]